MIYGVNFGAPDIPEWLRHGIGPRRIKGIPVARGTVAILAGCCSSAREKYAMTMQADNGHRKLHWESVDFRIGRGCPKETWHFVWAYYR